MCIKALVITLKMPKKQSEANVNKTTHRKGCLIKWKIMSTYTLAHTYTNIFMHVYSGITFYLIKNVARMRRPQLQLGGEN